MYLWFVVNQYCYSIFLVAKITIHFYRKFSEVLMLRDASLIPNYFWYEYTAARRETL